MEKRIILTLCFVIVLALVLASCGKNNSPDSSSIYSSNISSKIPTGVGYDITKDGFYKMNNYYATWLNVWNDANFSINTTDSRGVTYKVNDKWGSINMGNATCVNQIMTEVKAAGINIIVCDLTNGATRWVENCRIILKFCYENNMKMCVAINAANPEEFEKSSTFIYNTYVKDTAAWSSAYFYTNNKPFIVYYTAKKNYDALMANNTEGFRSKFETRWASGEDSLINKWGWQLESFVGAMPSQESMFVTPSICRHRKDGVENWRKHLSWLDYSFAIAKQSNPKFTIVGSYDDAYERNGWMLCDTSKAINPKIKYEKETDSFPFLDVLQKDIYGKISITAYYDRVKEWIAGKAKPFQPEGMILDGAYRTVAPDQTALTTNGISPNLSIVPTSDKGIESYIWFYHLGNNEYRMVRLGSGLSFEYQNDKIIATYDTENSNQRWKAEKSGSGYKFINVGSNNALSINSNTNWTLEKIITLD